MANHHIFNHQGADISSKDSWLALSVDTLPDGVALDDISLIELLNQQEKHDVLLPLSELLAQDLLDAESLDKDGGILKEVLALIRQHSSRIGVWFEASLLIERLDDLPKGLLSQDLIVVVVPAFADGRNFSVIQSLRKLGFSGEIRVVGAFGRDQIAYLRRVGADSFVVSEHDAKNNIAQAFSALASAHGGDSAASLPLFAGTAES